MGVTATGGTYVVTMRCGHGKGVSEPVPYNGTARAHAVALEQASSRAQYQDTVIRDGHRRAMPLFLDCAVCFPRRGFVLRAMLGVACPILRWLATSRG
jgi:hypothetical protein